MNIQMKLMSMIGLVLICLLSAIVITTNINRDIAYLNAKKNDALEFRNQWLTFTGVNKSLLITDISEPVYLIFLRKHKSLLVEITETISNINSNIYLKEVDKELAEAYRNSTFIWDLSRDDFNQARILLDSDLLKTINQKARYGSIIEIKERFKSKGNTREFLELDELINRISSLSSANDSFNSSLGKLISIINKKITAHESFSQKVFLFISIFLVLIVTISLLLFGNQIVKNLKIVIERNKEIEERRKVEDALRKSDQYNRMLFENSSIGLLLCKMDGTFIDVNQSLVNIIGYTIEEAKALTYWDVTPKDYAEQEQVQLESLNTIKRYGPYEKEYLHKDGHRIPVRLSGRLIEQNGESLIWSSIEDITAEVAANQARYESEQHFRQLVEHIREVFWLTDINKNSMVYISPAYEIVWGRSCQSLYENPISFLDAIHKEDRDRVIEAMKTQVEGPYNEDYRILQPDGSIRWIRDQSFPIKNQKGEVYRVAGIAEDITEEKLAHELLEQRVEDRTKELLSSETQHRSLIENVIDGVVTINNKGIIKSINPAVERLFGYSAVDLIGKNIKTLMPDPYQSEHDGYLSNYRNSKVKQIIGIGREVKGLRKDGTIFPLDLGVSEMMLEGEQLFIGIIHDVSKRIEAEYKIKESLSQLNATLEATTDGILVVDDTGKIQTFNQIFIDLWRIPKEVIAKKTDEAAITFVLTQLKNPDEFVSKVESLYSTPEAESFDILNFKDGRVFERYSRPQKIGNQIIGRVWGFRDVTARIEAERQLSDAKDNAEAANKAKSEFLSSMSHELRTPLNAILGFGQLLEIDKESFSEGQNASVQDILQGGYHLLHLINEVLDLAQIESGKFECAIEKVSLKETIMQCSNLIYKLAEESNIQINYGNPQKYIVLADQQRLKQVLINFLSNAIKYNRPNGKVTINYQAVENNRLRINVIDTGEGIYESDLEMLFQPFTRVGNKSANIEGTGIGLTISKELMALMDGAVGVSSVVGEGSTFWLEIKLAE